MKKMIIFAAVLFMALPTLASAAIQGECYNCHTMHNSENGVAVTEINGVVTGEALENLLRYDCVSCHANDVDGANENMPLGGSSVPQVLHNSGDDLAGGNFRYGIDGLATGSVVGSSDKVHNVVDLFAGQWDTNGGDAPLNPDNVTFDISEFGAPPGTAPAAHYHGLSREVFTTDFDTPFDAFTCAGARGCHGTRSQIVSGDTGDWDDNATTDNTFEFQRRTGMAAISGAHHNNLGGVRNDTGYNLMAAEAAFHDGTVVAAGYRFIPGLFGFENEARDFESATDHNEYFGNPIGFDQGDGCGSCHIEGHAAGGSSRASTNSTLKAPNNSMSGFCSTCHGKFHSAGTGISFANADYEYNGVSGAFLRHPSDYIIPSWGEYGYLDGKPYREDTPVARQDITGYTEGASGGTIATDDDMVMCLSCHAAHGSANDYILRFAYSGEAATAQVANSAADQAAALATGGCISCHSLKGAL